MKYPVFYGIPNLSTHHQINPSKCLNVLIINISVLEIWPSVPNQKRKGKRKQRIEYYSTGKNQQFLETKDLSIIE